MKNIYHRVLPTRWQRKPASIKIVSLSPYCNELLNTYQRHTIALVLTAHNGCASWMWIKHIFASKCFACLFHKSRKKQPPKYNLANSQTDAQKRKQKQSKLDMSHEHKISHKTDTEKLHSKSLWQNFCWTPCTISTSSTFNPHSSTYFFLVSAFTHQHISTTHKGNIQKQNTVNHSTELLCAFNK